MDIEARNGKINLRKLNSCWTDHKYSSPSQNLPNEIVSDTAY